MDENTFAEIKRSLRDEFPNVMLEFSNRIFSNHEELWVYVLDVVDVVEYERVQDACRRLTDAMGLERRDPEVWLLARAWTGPWPPGQSVEELQRRRDEFRQRHALTLGSGR